MSNTPSTKHFLKGGEFIVEQDSLEDIFIPEMLNEEQLMIKSTAEEFVQNEIFPNYSKIEHQEDAVTPKLLSKLGDLGFLGVDMPAAYGGMEMDTNTSTLIGEIFGPTGSFYVSFAGHTGIGMLPILYFGTEAQKLKYLPDLIAGNIKSAYCLTEPSSGSDALAAKTRADISPDGKHYILNGQKMWITNAGFADIFIVFAKVDGDKFTGFIVERNSAGLTFGAEEHKLGIKGSSTRQVFFENVLVPVENLLGEIGKGHLIAFNTLNIGRFKLCVACIGGAKGSITSAVKYANERIQFAQAISNFGAIQHKIAEQVIQTFAIESATYRVSNMMENRKSELMEEGYTYGGAKLEAAEEYAIECAILKVAGSEVLDFVVDETLQIHGGMGYSEEGTAARAYRDSRINRIFEGTNEINRLLTVDMLFKRALKGTLNFVGAAWEVQKELATIPSFSTPEGSYGPEMAIVSNFKKVALMVGGAMAKQQMDGLLNLKEEQELLMNLADIMIDILLAESVLLRVKKMEALGTFPAGKEVYDAILKTFLSDKEASIRKNASDAIASFASGDLLNVFMLGLKRYLNYPPVSVKKNRRIIAKAIIEANKYCL